MSSIFDSRKPCRDIMVYCFTFMYAEDTVGLTDIIKVDLHDHLVAFLKYVIDEH